MTKNGARGKYPRELDPRTRSIAYGCTFRPDQVHNFPLRGNPHSSLPRASVMQIVGCRFEIENTSRRLLLFILKSAISNLQSSIPNRHLAYYNWLQRPP